MKLIRTRSEMNKSKQIISDNVKIFKRYGHDILKSTMILKNVELTNIKTQKCKFYIYKQKYVIKKKI